MLNLPPDRSRSNAPRSKGGVVAAPPKLAIRRRVDQAVASSWGASLAVATRSCLGLGPLLYRWGQRGRRAASLFLLAPDFLPDLHAMYGDLGGCLDTESHLAVPTSYLDDRDNDVVAVTMLSSLRRLRTNIDVPP